MATSNTGQEHQLLHSLCFFDDLSPQLPQALVRAWQVWINTQSILIGFLFTYVACDMCMSDEFVICAQVIIELLATPPVRRVDEPLKYSVADAG